MTAVTLERARSITTDIAVAAPDGDDAELMRLLVRGSDDDQARLRAIGDALTLAIAKSDRLLQRVDLKRARALLEREVRIARGGAVHLMPVYLYLAGQTELGGAAAVAILDTADAMRRQGTIPVVPECVRRRDALARRPAIAQPTRRRPRSTRSSVRLRDWIMPVVGLASAALAAQLLVG